MKENFFKSQIDAIKEAQMEGWQKQVAILRNIESTQVVIKDSIEGKSDVALEKFRAYTDLFRQMAEEINVGNIKNLEKWISDIDE